MVAIREGVNFQQDNLSHLPLLCKVNVPGYTIVANITGLLACSPSVSNKARSVFPPEADPWSVVKDKFVRESVLMVVSTDSDYRE